MISTPRIVFYGTPSFAVASLQQLVAEGLSPVAVVTAPDKPAGRGLRLSAPAVKEFALAHGIPVLQPISLKAPSFLEALKILNPDIQIVVAFRMMPREVWALPPLGTFNLHASLLPQYRGAAPINWAIINGETETGVTTFLLEEKVDAGRILLTERTLIGPNETAGELYDRLMIMGAQMVVKTARALVEGNVTAISQPGLIPAGTVLKPAPKLNRDTTRIDWSQDHLSVFNLIRGMSPSPCAYTELSLKDGTSLSLKILRGEPIGEPGIREGSGFQSDGKTFFRIPARDGFIGLIEVQPAGKRVMDIREFLNGFGRLMF